jgi:hypothetical protein
MATSVYYVNLNNAHVKTEKLYASIRCDTIADLVEWVEKEEKKKKYVQCHMAFVETRTSND